MKLPRKSPNIRALFELRSRTAKKHGKCPLKLALASFLRRLTSAMQFPILAYHSLLLDGRTRLPSGWNFSETIFYSRFCAQLHVFSASGWQTFPARDLSDPTTWELPEKRILFTFDDGHDSDLLAADALGERGFTGMFFIPWSNVGRPHFLTGGGIKQLCRNGFTIGSHGLTHSRLASLSGGLLSRELVESKARLEDLIGQPVKNLAIPFGRYNRSVIEAAHDAGYTAIMTSKIGLASPGCESRVFPRIPVKPAMTDSLVYALIKGSILAGLKCRFQGSVLRRSSRILARAASLVTNGTDAKTSRP